MDDAIELAIINIKKNLMSPDLAEDIANSLSNHLQEGFLDALEPRSGATLKALSYISDPVQAGSGWEIGVGDANALGSQSDAAPEGTLREFFTDNPELRPGPWKSIPEDYQAKLAQMRRTGMYGGRGPDYANYMWVQNRGSGSAYINATNFIEPAIDRWRDEVPSIIDEWERNSVMAFGQRVRRARSWKPPSTRYGW